MRCKMHFVIISWLPTRGHDDVIKWKHFPCYWPFVRGIHRSRWIPRTKASDAGALMFSLIYAWIKDWVNTREAGDLRRHRGNYDVIVMARVISIQPRFSWYKNSMYSSNDICCAVRSTGAHLIWCHERQLRRLKDVSTVLCDVDASRVTKDLYILLRYLKIMSNKHICWEILLSTIRSWRNGEHFADDIFKCIVFAKYL